MLVIAEAGVAELGIRVSHQQYETSGRMIVYGTLAFPGKRGLYVLLSEFLCGGSRQTISGITV